MKNEDVELVHRILAGDETAFASLVEKYQKQVHALAWRKIGDFHIAEEITQDTFLKVHQKLATLKNPNQFSGWLYVIATNQCRAWLRKKRVETESLEDTETEWVDEAAYSRYVAEEQAKATTETQREVVQKLLAKLKESERTVMTLHYFGEMTVEEISRFLGVSTSAIKLRLHRARQRLKKEEPMIREVLSNFQLSPNLTDNVMQKIERTKPTAPSGSKPFIPWVIGASTALLIVLMLGMGSQYLARFQQPYSLDARSDMTVELIDVPIVLNLEAKPDVQNQFGGKSDDPGRGDGTGQESNQVLSDKGDYTKWELPEGAKTRFGKGGITEVTYSPDGTRLAVAGNIGIWIYDAQTGEELALFTGHTGGVNSISFSLDGRVIASGSDDNTIRLWDGNTGIHLNTLSGHTDWVNSVSFSPDGQTLASGGEDNTVRLWDVRSGELLHTINEHTDSVTSVSFSPDGQVLASGSVDKTIRLWNVSTNDLLYTLTEHTSDVNSISFSPDGQLLASGSSDWTICLWDVGTGELHRRLDEYTGKEAHKASDEVHSVSFSPDGQTLASGSVIKIHFWNVSTGELRRTLTEHTSWLFSVAFSPDGRTLASGGGDIWDVHTGTLLRTLSGHTNWIFDVAFSPDGQLLASGGDDNKIRLWDVSTGKHLHTLLADMSDVFTVAFSPDSRVLASGSMDNMIRLWDVHTGELLRTIDGQTHWTIRSISFSPDGRTLASGGDNSTICLWDVNTSELRQTLIGHGGSVESISFSPDGQVLASGSGDDTIRLWDVSTDESLHPLSGYTDTDDVERVVLISSGKVTGIILRGHTANVNSVSFSPDGQTLASGSNDDTVRLWDVSTGKPLQTLSGHTANINSVSFSPDSRVLASGSSDNTIRLWDVRSGKYLVTLSGHTNAVYSVAFSPKGRFIASGSRDGTVLLWDVTIAK